MKRTLNTIFAVAILAAVPLGRAQTGASGGDTTPAITRVEHD